MKQPPFPPAALGVRAGARADPAVPIALPPTRRSELLMLPPWQPRPLLLRQPARWRLQVPRPPSGANPLPTQAAFPEAEQERAQTVGNGGRAWHWTGSTYAWPWFVPQPHGVWSPRYAARPLAALRPLRATPHPLQPVSFCAVQPYPGQPSHPPARSRAASRRVQPGPVSARCRCQAQRRYPTTTMTGCACLRRNPRLGSRFRFQGRG
eukprot:SAG22_NODE_1949_length_3273_cov_5.400126_2_plen_208_part_00